MKATDMHEAGKITTTGEAEEGSTHKLGSFTSIIRGPVVYFAWDAISVPRQFSRLQAWMIPSPGQLHGLVTDVRL